MEFSASDGNGMKRASFDEGAYRFRRGCRCGISGQMRLTS